MERKNARNIVRWRSESAVHEAGHAVAYWAIGVLPLALWIPAYPGQEMVDDRGRVRILAGFCDARFFSNVLLLNDQLLRNSPMVIKHAQLSAMCTLAGPIAEARFRRCSSIGVLLTTGKDDFELVQNTLRYIAPDEGTYYRLEVLVEAAARRLLSMYATSVSALAEELKDKGEVDMDGINRIIETHARHKKPRHGEAPPWLAPKLYADRHVVSRSACHRKGLPGWQ